MFVAYVANVNGFKLGCRMILFEDNTHLNGPYKGTLVTVCALDADNHLFNFAYGIVYGEKIGEWVWFLETIAECMGCVNSVIMSNRNPAIATAVA